MLLMMMMRTAAAMRALLSLFPPPLWAGLSHMTELSRFEAVVALYNLSAGRPCERRDP